MTDKIDLDVLDPNEDDSNNIVYTKKDSTQVATEFIDVDLISDEDSYESYDESYDSYDSDDEGSGLRICDSDDRDYCSSDNMDEMLLQLSSGSSTYNDNPMSKEKITRKLNSCKDKVEKLSNNFNRYNKSVLATLDLISTLNMTSTTINKKHKIYNYLQLIEDINASINKLVLESIDPTQNMLELCKENDNSIKNNVNRIIIDSSSD